MSLFTASASLRCLPWGHFIAPPLRIIGLVVAFSWALPRPAVRAADPRLSFNLERREDASGDYPLEFYSFRCGNKVYTFCPPAAWKITGDAANMSFTFSTSDGDAVARFRISSATELGLLNPDQSARREPTLRLNLPAGFTDLQQVGTEDSNPTPTLGTKGCEIAYRFNFFGHALMASVMICQMDEKNGFTLVTTAPAAAGKEFIAQVRRTLGAVDVVQVKAPGSTQ